MKATIATVAKALGVSPMTVSRVINHVPKVSAEKRRLIMAELKRQGYQRGPVLSAWQVSVRGDRVREQPNVVFLSGIDEKAMERSPFERIRAAAVARATGLGLSMSFFHAAPSQMNWSRMGQILTARGVSGVIVGPFPQDFGSIQLPLEHFALVACGEDQGLPSVHRATQNYYSDMRRLFQLIKRRGFQRPGLIMERSDRPSRRQWLGAFLEGQSWLKPVDRIPVFFLTGKEGKSNLLKWVETARPDVLMTLPGAAQAQVTELLSDRQETPSYGLGLSSDLDAKASGLLYPAEGIGRAAVELLAEQLRNYERGRPRVPKSIRVMSVLLEEGEPVRFSDAPAGR
jgi:LacI family transcriptional regulator